MQVVHVGKRGHSSEGEQGDDVRQRCAEAAFIRLERIMQVRMTLQLLLPACCMLS